MCDGALAPLDSAGALIDGRQIRVHVSCAVPAVTAAALAGVVAVAAAQAHVVAGSTARGAEAALRLLHLSEQHSGTSVVAGSGGCSGGNG